MKTNFNDKGSAVCSKCEEIHDLFNKMERYSFPFSKGVPKNGVYILFEKGEKAHNGDRIVRVGTHTGEGQLNSRLRQHFEVKNKDRSIFRKNIGRAFLRMKNDPFLAQWEWDMTTKAAKEKYKDLLDENKKHKLEGKVSEYIQSKLSFTVFEVNSKEERLYLESKIISTVSLCNDCQPSKSWLGLSSPKEKIQKSGLWLVNELYKDVLTDFDMKRLYELCRKGGCS